MPAVEKNLSVEQGATFKFFFQWRVPSGATTVPKNLTGWIFRMQARKTQQATAIIDATTTNGKITIGVDPDDEGATPDPTNGWVRVKLTDDDTDLLTTASTRYDLEGEEPVTEDVYRVLQGSVLVSGNITQEITDPPMEG